MGVWIETLWESKNTNVLKVTPCVGVWIETDLSALSIRATESHPAWVCGLKLLLAMLLELLLSHTLRGCVD